MKQSELDTLRKALNSYKVDTQEALSDSLKSGIDADILCEAGGLLSIESAYHALDRLIIED